MSRMQSNRPSVDVDHIYRVSQGGRALFNGYAVMVLETERQAAMVETLARPHIVTRLDMTEVEMAWVPDEELLADEREGLREMRQGA